MLASYALSSDPLHSADPARDTMSVVDGLQEEIREALDSGRFGLGLLDESLHVVRREGAMSDWLPPEGAVACDSPLLLHMEKSLEALKESGGEFVLPSMRYPAEGGVRITISIGWNPRDSHFLVVTTPDHGGDQIDRLLAGERREKQVLQQQHDAASAKMRIASALYRDIVEFSGDLVFRFQPDFSLVFANREAARFLGKPQNNLLGEKLSELFPTPEAAPWRIDRAAERPAAFEMSTRDAEGHAIWLAWDIRFLGAEGGGEFQATARDVTSERRLRVERERAQEEAGEAAVANERLRIAHELHDTLVRSIVTLIAETRLIAKTTDDPRAKSALVEMEALAREGLAEAREAIMQMRAARPDSAGLKVIVDAFAAQAGAPAVESEFEVDSRELPRETEQLLVSVLREALRNIELHAGASNVRVSLRAEGDHVRLDIVDDGVGFFPEKPVPGHFGVVGMRERARLGGASLGIASAPGSGARVTLVAARPIVEAKG